MVKYWMAVVGAMIRNPGNTAIVLVIWISLVFVEKYFFSTWFLGVILMILCALTPMSIDYVDSKLKKETEE
jgi:ABC-type transport system involved in cytochrome bd biosynthesis fused ATPase/permease subunit